MKPLTEQDHAAWTLSRSRYPDFAHRLLRMDDDRLVIIDAVGMCWFAAVVLRERREGAGVCNTIEPILTPTEGPYSARWMRDQTGEVAIEGHARGIVVAS